MAFLYVLPKHSQTQFVPYESPILGQLLDLIAPAKINLFELRFKSYGPWDMESCLSQLLLKNNNN